MKARALRLVLPLFLLGAAAWADGDAGGQPAPAAQDAAAKDVVVLKDGRRVEGEVVAEDDRFVSVKSGGVTRAYAKDSVTSIEKAARAAGQPGPSATPGPAAPRPAGPSAEPAAKGKKNKGDKRDGQPISDAGKKWLDDLIARTADADESIRRSVGAAIGAMGPQAVPVLRAAEAAAADGPQKQFLGKLAADMEQRRDRRGRGEPGMPGDGMGPDSAMPGDQPRGDQPNGGGPNGRRRLEDMMQRLTTDLELTDEQKPKAEAILRQSMGKRLEIGRDARRDGLTAEQVAEKVTALRNDLLAQMKDVLTEPQYSMFEQAATRMFEMAPPAAVQPTPPKPPADAPKPADPAASKPPEPVK